MDVFVNISSPVSLPICEISYFIGHINEPTLHGHAILHFITSHGIHISHWRAVDYILSWRSMYRVLRLPGLSVWSADTIYHRVISHASGLIKWFTKNKTIASIPNVEELLLREQFITSTKVEDLILGFRISNDGIHSKTELSNKLRPSPPSFLHLWVTHLDSWHLVLHLIRKLLWPCLRTNLSLHWNVVMCLVRVHLNLVISSLLRHLWHLLRVLHRS